MQFQHTTNPNYFIFYKSDEFVVGEQVPNGRLFLRAKNSKNLRCPFPEDGWKFRFQGGSNWVFSSVASVMCFEDSTTETPPTVGSANLEPFPGFNLKQSEITEASSIVRCFY